MPSDCRGRTQALLRACEFEQFSFQYEGSRLFFSPQLHLVQLPEMFHASFFWGVLFGTLDLGSVDSISDPRYVKRIDPSDGIARSLAELKQRFQGSMNDEQLEIYWDKCPSLYPQDTESLITLIILDSL